MDDNDKCVVGTALAEQHVDEFHDQVSGRHGAEDETVTSSGSSHDGHGILKATRQPTRTNDSS